MLQLLFWAKTEDGQKNKNRPEPMPRPGAKSETQDTRSKTVTVADYLRMVADAKAKEG